MALRLRRLALSEVPWGQLDDLADRTVFQTRPWLEFLAESRRVEPVLAVLEEAGRIAGWFTGGVIRRAGLGFLGSPLPGWTTSYMGFNLLQPVEPGALLLAVQHLAFTELRCVHLELMDRAIPATVHLPPRYAATPFSGFELRLDRDDSTLLAGMKAHGRRDVRRAGRNGIEIEEIDPVTDPTFAADYYRDVVDAFAKRGLSPAFGLERVDSLIRHLHPTGNLLLLRATTAEGQRAATGIFPGLRGRGAVYWMGASDRSLQHLLPNEALMWHAIRSWRDRGAVRLDFGGGGPHKAKYGGEQITVPWLRSPRFASLESAREVTRRVVRASQRRRLRR